MSKMQPSVEGFADWLKKQSVEKEYCWSTPSMCAIGKYYEYLGLKYSYIAPSRLELDMEDISLPAPHTFGACAKRARAAL